MTLNESTADLPLDHLRLYAEESLPALSERKPSIKSGDRLYNVVRTVAKTLKDYNNEQDMLDERSRALEAQVRDIQQFLVGIDQDFHKNLAERIKASDR